VRTVVWTQGCTLACPGCFNPATHPAGGASWPVADLAERISSFGTDRVTISGGEPLDQAAAVIELARRCRQAGRSVILFTGYAWAQLRRNRPGVVAGLQQYVDVVVAGRYVAARRIATGLRGSDNKTVHLLTDRYRLEEIEATAVAEVLIGADGTVTTTGVDPFSPTHPTHPTHPTDPTGPPDGPTPMAAGVSA
jgi:anaerobic ribonucleoside-triphosphate reductase activating protein